MVFAVLPVTVKLVEVFWGVFKPSGHVGAHIDRFFFKNHQHLIRYIAGGMQSSIDRA